MHPAGGVVGGGVGGVPPYQSQQLVETPDILLQPVHEGNAAPVMSAYSRAPSMTQLHHQHSHSSSASGMALPPPSSLDVASSLVVSAVPPPPAAVDLFMQRDFAAAFKSALGGIDMLDYKQNKHQLPLARIKKIMKSDEDVRMISAEAPVLFAKACELFILDLSMRAWAYVEHSPSGGPGVPRRRTLQRNDVASAIQNSELFDFLYQIVPILPPNPDEEGTPPHHADMDDEPRYNARTNSTPDVLLERPLHDPYSDTLPPMHTPRGHIPRVSSSSFVHRTASGLASNGMSDDPPLTLLSSPSVGVPHDSYGMTSMSRGTSQDPNGVNGAISTPVFNGMPLELMPDDSGNMHSGMTPVPPHSHLHVPPQTPGAFYHPASHTGVMMPSTPITMSVGGGPYLGVGGAHHPVSTPWMDGPGPNSPQPASTPSGSSLSVANTPNFHSGYSGSVEEETE